MALNAYQHVNGWLSKINPHDKELALDQYGQCQLRNGDGEKYNVFVPSPDGTTVVLFADVWLLPEGIEAAVYENLLALNLQGMTTSSGVLGFDKQLRSLVFFYSRDIEATDAKLFLTIVENFFITAADLKKVLANVFKSPNKPSASNRQSSPSMLHKSFRSTSS